MNIIRINNNKVLLKLKSNKTNRDIVNRIVNFNEIDNKLTIFKKGLTTLLIQGDDIEEFLENIIIRDNYKWEFKPLPKAK